MEYPIDFVITWVNGQDAEWRKQRARFQERQGEDNSECRYRAWGTLRYWFRGVEQFAPWVRKIHLVTYGHLPPWLNVNHPKLHIVRHKDYIPEEFLPTFNSNVLEIYLHRIENLSEHFVYFNDDMFLTQPVKHTDFFVKGKPCDMLAFQPVVANPSNPIMSHLLLNNMVVLCKYFNKRDNVRKNPGNYFHLGYPPLYFFYNMLEMLFPLYTGLYTVHGPSAFCKNTFKEIWEKEENALLSMSENRFRSKNDLTPYLFREWQKLSDNFCPRNILKNFRYQEISDKNMRLMDKIQKCKMLCINDTMVTGDLEKAGIELRKAFNQILPKASPFEI